MCNILDGLAICAASAADYVNIHPIASIDAVLMTLIITEQCETAACMARLCRSTPTESEAISE